MTLRLTDILFGFVCLIALGVGLAGSAWDNARRYAKSETERVLIVQVDAPQAHLMHAISILNARPEIETARSLPPREAASILNKAAPNAIAADALQGLGLIEARLKRAAHSGEAVTRIDAALNDQSVNAEIFGGPRTPAPTRTGWRLWLLAVPALAALALIAALGTDASGARYLAQLGAGPWRAIAGSAARAAERGFAIGLGVVIVAVGLGLGLLSIAFGGLSSDLMDSFATPLDVAIALSAPIGDMGLAAAGAAIAALRAYHHGDRA